MIEWRKISYNENFPLDMDKVYIIPQESGGCSIYCGDEYCTVNGFSVDELVDRLKFCLGFKISAKLSMAEFKTLIENILKENNNE